MSISALFYLFIEVILIASTTVLMIQSKSENSSSSKGFQVIAHWGGIILLCLTFCWSIILGIFLGMNDLTIHV